MRRELEDELIDETWNGIFELMRDLRDKNQTLETGLSVVYDVWSGRWASAFCHVCMHA